MVLVKVIYKILGWLALVWLSASCRQTAKLDDAINVDQSIEVSALTLKENIALNGKIVLTNIQLPTFIAGESLSGLFIQSYSYSSNLEQNFFCEGCPDWLRIHPRTGEISADVPELSLSEGETYTKKLKIYVFNDVGMDFSEVSLRVIAKDNSDSLSLDPSSFVTEIGLPRLSSGQKSRIRLTYKGENAQENLIKNYPIQVSASNHSGVIKLEAPYWDSEQGSYIQDFLAIEPGSVNLKISIRDNTIFEKIAAIKVFDTTMPIIDGLSLWLRADKGLQQDGEDFERYSMAESSPERLLRPSDCPRKPRTILYDDAEVRVPVLKFERKSINRIDNQCLVYQNLGLYNSKFSGELSIFLVAKITSHKTPQVLLQSTDRALTWDYFGMVVDKGKNSKVGLNFYVNSLSSSTSVWSPIQSDKLALYSAFLRPAQTLGKTQKGWLAQILVNGKLVDEGLVPAIKHKQDTPFWIGANGLTGNTQSDFEFAELLIYDRQLSEKEQIQMQAYFGGRFQISE